MTEHTLKLWPAYFDAVADGRKRFEVRSTRDRTFAVGDVLVLREWDPQTEAYSGRSVRVVVTFVLGAPFAPEGSVILSIDPAHEWEHVSDVATCVHCGLSPLDAVRFSLIDGTSFATMGQCVTKGEGR